MIGGLLRNHNNNSIDRAPFLGNLPILGALFRSTRFRRDETELVIVVTPYLVRPVSANQIALPTDGYRNPDEAQRLLLGQMNASRTGEQRPGPTAAEPRTVAPGRRHGRRRRRAGAGRPALRAPTPPPARAVEQRFGPARLQLLMTARARKDATTMSRFITLAAVSALGLAVAGCAAQPRQLTPANNPSVYSLHQPVVERTNFVFDLRAERRPRARRRAGAARRLVRLDRRSATATASRSTSRAATNRPARATTSPGSPADYGLLLTRRRAGHRGRGPAGHGPRRRQPRRAPVSRAARTGRDPGIESPVRTGTNYGCAINSNLAAMIANPDDLVHGQDGSGRDSAATAGRAIRTYRERAPTGRQALPAPTTTRWN